MEIIGSNFFCNLSDIHLNQIGPYNYKEQEEAFTAGALSVAALLNHKFVEPRYQYSRQLDPIVGVSFTGLFDFFVNAFGVDWLRWWTEGRPETERGLEFKRQEQEYLSWWREIVHQTVWDYCDRHNLKRPNRCTTVQPSGCLSREALRIFDGCLLYADELMLPGGGEYSFSEKLSVRNGLEVKTGIANAPLHLIKVTLANGRILRMTPNHRLFIQSQSGEGDWVRADEMIVGMGIDFSLGQYQSTEERSLLPAVVSSSGTPLGRPPAAIRTPETMTPDLAYWLGALFGNGCLSPNKHRIRFSHGDIKVLNRLSHISDDLFGLKGVIRHTIDRNSGELTIASRCLFDWLKQVGLDKSVKSKNLDRIPVALRRSSRDSILSFFAGLIDTDGCIRGAGSLIINSASEKFLRNLQQVGEAVGLCFSLSHETKGRNLQPQKSMWGISLSRMTSVASAIEYLNAASIKASDHPISLPKREFKFNPYQIVSVEWEAEPDYSYDVAVDGTDDDDSWYWQGAIKSHNTKSLLTGASPGWHPPKAQRFIRRITFRKNDPVALACIDYGYNVIPSQSDKDENGNLLNDPFDPRCSEWLVEIPVSVPWADLPGSDEIDISKFSAIAQMDFYMLCQKFYARHNVSATIELRENEIEVLGTRIYEAIQNDEGYISAALLARFDSLQTFPRLPFEPITKSEYAKLTLEVVKRRKTDDFHAALSRYDFGDLPELGPAGCDSDKCLLPEQQP